MVGSGPRVQEAAALRMEAQREGPQEGGATSEKTQPKQKEENQQDLQPQRQEEEEQGEPDAPQRGEQKEPEQGGEEPTAEAVLRRAA